MQKYNEIQKQHEKTHKENNSKHIDLTYPAYKRTVVTFNLPRVVKFAMGLIFKYQRQLKNNKTNLKRTKLKHQRQLKK